MIQIEPFDAAHIEQAAGLAARNYQEERSVVPELPDGDYVPQLRDELGALAGNGLGVAAVQSGNVVGFLACCEPMPNHFGTTLGTFSPIHAHGAIAEGRRMIYARLYQAAAERWVNNGILSHAIALYAHDREVVDGFFWNGFGLRCVDAIRDCSPIAAKPFKGCTVKRLSVSDADVLLSQTNALRRHLLQTPMFIPLFTPLKLEDLVQWMLREGNEFHGAYVAGRLVSYLKLSPTGENSACSAPDMRNICGAYTLPEHRASGVSVHLLMEVVMQLRERGFTRCGVDFESFNPNASGFWLKFFKPYTYSVVRRIDERICTATDAARSE